MKTIFIDSSGCTENIIDGTIIKDIAEANDYILIKDPSKADLIVFNTCAFKQKQEELSVKKIKKYQKIKKTDAEIIVCGCLVGINKKSLQNVFDGVTFAPTNLKTFYDVLKVAQPEKIEEPHHITRDISDFEMFGTRAIVEKIYDVKKYLRKQFHLNLLPNFDFHDYIGDEKTLFVRISRGCLNECGYCAIRFAQGRLVSQPLKSVIETIKNGIAAGYQKIFIIATNTSHYGKDIGTSFYRLLEEILQLDGNYKLIIHNFEPFGVQENPQKFLELFSSQKILSFYFPINSASQFVLNRMNRNYDIENIKDTLKQLKQLNPRILIRTEFIVGYPGERWKDFFKTLSLFLRFRFDYIDLHYFSPRPNTPAVKLDKQLSWTTKYIRFLIINIVAFFRVTVRKLRPV